MHHLTRELFLFLEGGRIAVLVRDHQMPEQGATHSFVFTTRKTHLTFVHHITREATTAQWLPVTVLEQVAVCEPT